MNPEARQRAKRRKRMESGIVAWREALRVVTESIMGLRALTMRDPLLRVTISGLWAARAAMAQSWLPVLLVCSRASSFCWRLMPALYRLMRALTYSRNRTRYRLRMESGRGRPAGWRYRYYWIPAPLLHNGCRGGSWTC